MSDRQGEVAAMEENHALTATAVGVVVASQRAAARTLLNQAIVRAVGSCAVLGVPNVVAAGDILRWAHPRFGEIRVEHWTHAAESAMAAARTLLAVPGTSPTYDPPLYFWSSQYDCTITSVGIPQRGERTGIVEGSVKSGQFISAQFSGDQLVGAVAVNMPEQLRAYQDRVGRPTRQMTGAPA